MKIDIIVQAELRDWVKERKLSLKVHIGTCEAEDGTKFTISQSSLVLFVGQDDTSREAVVDLRPVVEAMVDALHSAKLDKEAEACTAFK